MTREEAKVILKGFIENPLYSDIPKVCRAFDMAIKALEQEPCDDCCNGNQIEKAKLCQKSYIAGMEHKQELKTDVLDKIKAEVASAHLIGYAIINGKREIASKAVMEIIDKYKTDMLK